MIKILHMTPPDVNNGVYRYIFSHMKYMDGGRFRSAFLTKGAKKLRQTPEYRNMDSKYMNWRGSSGTVQKRFARRSGGYLTMDLTSCICIPVPGEDL